MKKEIYIGAGIAITLVLGFLYLKSKKKESTIINNPIPSMSKIPDSMQTTNPLLQEVTSYQLPDLNTPIPKTMTDTSTITPTVDVSNVAVGRADGSTAFNGINDGSDFIPVQSLEKNVFF